MNTISVVTSLYNSSGQIEEFYARTLHAVHQTGCDHHFVFVNDGSPDDSLQVAITLTTDPKVTVVDLSKNFGQHQALVTGLGYAHGNYVCVLDSDLEEPPEVLVDFFHTLSTQDDVDVVYGVRKKRHDPLISRVFSNTFYYFFQKLTGIKDVNNILILRLMTKRYVQALLLHEEKTLFISGLFHLTGFKQLAVEVDKTYKGHSSYSWARRIILALDAITSFSSKPLNYIAAFGLGIAMISFLFAASIIYRKLIHHVAITGWASLATSIWMLGGLIMFSIGTVGIYISKVFTEVKNRPLAIVRQIYSTKSD